VGIAGLAGFEEVLKTSLKISGLEGLVSSGCMFTTV
jgi:hypothetical protein